MQFQSIEDNTHPAWGDRPENLVHLQQSLLQLRWHGAYHDFNMSSSALPQVGEAP